eukprot:TRINITY_DN7151_c0_g2_i1.p1 TRINITY_DN7151_c0_g2~~TRINITY_DN7151_c0_g2_i1.p1  ORF type:complete len:1651 (-),score=581.40 TRINITY_DN7151_c0_g2_i1:343-5295(-)
MGKNQSRLKEVLEAKNQLHVEYPLLAQGFERVRGVNGVDFIHFRRAIMGIFPQMPEKIAIQLFKAFVVRKDQMFMSLDDLICASAVLLHGPFDKQVEFLFRFYSNNGKHIAFDTFMTILGAFELAGMQKEGERMFQEIKTKNIKLENFMHWCQINNTSPVITWLNAIREAVVPETSISETPADTVTTKFDPLQSSKLAAAFKDLSSDFGILDQSSWRTIMTEFPIQLSQSLFRAFDKDRDGKIDFNDFVGSVWTCCEGSVEAKDRFLFDMFDSNHSGSLNEKEVAVMLECVLTMSDDGTEGAVDLGGRSRKGSSLHGGLNTGSLIYGANNGNGASTTNNGKPPLRRMISQGVIQRWKTVSEKEVLMLTEQAFAQLSLRLNHEWSFADFVTWASANTKVRTFNDLVKRMSLLHFGVLPSGIEEERLLIKNLYTRPYKADDPGAPGTTWCLIDCQWWRKWARYVEFYKRDGDRQASEASVPDRPGKIDNSTLITNGSLSTELSYGHDYVIIPTIAFMCLMRWYGGGPTLRFAVVESRDGKRDLELYPPLIEVYRSLNGKRVYVGDMRFSKVNTWGEVRSHVVTYLRSQGVKGIGSDTTRLWQHDKDCSWEVAQEDETLEERDVNAGHCVLLETMLKTGDWSLSQSKEFNDESARLRAGQRKYYCGLQNLGNTCFFNSSLQCLRAVRPLTDYFTNERLYEFDLRVGSSNKRGTGGRLAAFYAELLQIMESGGRTSYAPRKLKHTIGQVQPQFEGYEQHDAQELLAFFLDRLHEDLNRVHNKTYIEQPDSDGRPDNLVAGEWWNNHICRDNSIVTALFTGQFKSDLVCQTCSKQSSRFETFDLLAISLPEPTDRVVTLTLFFEHHIRRPLIMAVKVPRDGTMMDIKRAIVSMQPGLDESQGQYRVKLSAEELRLGVIYDCVPQLRIGDNVSLNQLSEHTKVVCYQITVLPKLLAKPIGLFELGDTVTASYKGSQQRYNGYICAVNGDGTYDVKFFDGDKDTHITAGNITHVTAQTATIRGVHRQLLNDSSKWFLKSKKRKVINDAFIINFYHRLTTGRQLYSLIWKQVRRYAKNGDPSMYLAEPHGKVLKRTESVAIASLGSFVSKKTENPSLISPTASSTANIVAQSVAAANAEAAEARNETTSDGPAGPESTGPESAEPSAETSGSVNPPVNNEEEETQETQEVESGSSNKGESFLFEEEKTGSEDEGDETNAADNENNTEEQQQEDTEQVEDHDDEDITADFSDEDDDDLDDFHEILDTPEKIEKEWGFVLRISNSQAPLQCRRCDWTKGCEGCIIKPDDTPPSFFAGELLAVDWSSKSLEEDLNMNKLTHTDEHRSLASKDQVEKPRKIQACLGQFIRRENITAHCSNCSKRNGGEYTETQSHKKIDIWGCPPVLAIQLKRFCFSQSSHKKLRDFVEFPLEGLDMSPFISKDQKEPPKVDSSMWRFLGGRLEGESEQNIPNDQQNDDDIQPIRPTVDRTASHRRSATCIDSPTSSGNMLPPAPQHYDGFDITPGGPSTSPSHRRSVSEAPQTSNKDKDIPTPPFPIKPPSRKNTRYNLHAVVNHLGQLGAGHYHSYVKCGNQWKWCNDHRVIDIPASKVCSPNAYLLFYVREDIDAAAISPYELFPPVTNKRADVTNLLKDKSGGGCTIM